MAEFGYAVNSGELLLIPEFKPFEKKDLIAYLKGYTLHWQQLQQRQQQIMQKMKELEKNKTVNGQDFNDRIDSYAYGNQGDAGAGSSGNRYSPDTLFNRWFKIYCEPYENQKKIYTNSMVRIIYEQWQMETVNRCVEMLPIEYRHLIISVYIERQKVASYCELFQLGHDRYNQMKEQALHMLLDSCNESLAMLRSNWEDMYAKSLMDTEYSVTGGRSDISMAGI